MRRRTSPRAVAAHWKTLLARERGTPTIIPPAQCQVALVYPGTYAVGMSSLGYQMVYRWINEHPAALAERFFCEGRPAVAADVSRQTRARSVEHGRPLDPFDLVAFSVAYELEYLDVVRFVLANRITPFAAERDPAGEPILLAGGICLSVNRLPIHDLADVLVLGDGETITTRLLDAWVAADGDRPRFLRAIQAIPGVEVTAGACRRFGLEPAGLSHGATTAPPAPRPHVEPALDSTDACSMIVTPDAEFADRFLVEIARGCPYRCRFCFLGHAMPCRTRPFEAVREMIERGRLLTNRFGLIAAAVGSHPEVERICEYGLREGLEVSFSSLRVEDVKPSMLELLVAGGQKVVTIAPEAGSERLRRSLGKRLTDAQVIESAAGAAGRGLTDLRLYFMVGLPDEAPEDVEAIARLVEAARRAAHAARPNGRGRVEVSANVSIYVPKPGTAFAPGHTDLEKLRVPSIAEIRKRLRRLAALLGRIEGASFRMPSPATAQAQRRLTWGDRQMLPRLIAAAEAGSGWRRVLAAPESS